MTIAQQARIRGFKANLNIRGREMVTDDKRAVTLLVEDVAPIDDPDKPAQQKKPVYAFVVALAGSLPDARAVETFTEVGTSKTWTVIYYDETSADQVTWRWYCEASRAPDVDPEFS